MVGCALNFIKAGDFGVARSKVDDCYKNKTKFQF